MRETSLEDTKLNSQCQSRGSLLQPPMETVAKKVVSLQPAEVYGGPDTQLQPVDEGDGHPKKAVSP